MLTSLRDFPVNKRFQQPQQALSRVEDIENNMYQVVYFMRRAYVAHRHCNHNLTVQQSAHQNIKLASIYLH